MRSKTKMSIETRARAGLARVSIWLDAGRGRVSSFDFGSSCLRPKKAMVSRPRAKVVMAIVSFGCQADAYQMRPQAVAQIRPAKVSQGHFLK